MDNIDTVVAIYKAVMQGMPLMHRIVTVTGDGIADPQNFYVPIGTNYQELIDAAGGLKGQPKKLISGGPMMGFSMFDLNVPVTKTTSSLLCLQKDDVAEQPETACINCGRCVSGCPEHLVPSRLAKIAEHHDYERFEKMNGMNAANADAAATSVRQNGRWPSLSNPCVRKSLPTAGKNRGGEENE